MEQQSIHESDLIGEGRKLLVDGLVKIYENMSETSTPVWVALEAPSGSGKTRLVREFYARLAGTQSTPSYWPQTMLHTRKADLDLRDVNERRKWVNPDFDHVPGSLPDYMWWGITCFRRSEFVQSALVQDFAVLKNHEPYLAIRWALQNPAKANLDPIFRKLGRGFHKALKDGAKEGFIVFGKNALAEVVDKAAVAAFVKVVSEQFALSVLPGFGWLLNVGVTSVFETAGRKKRQAKKRASSDAITHDNNDVLLDAFKILTTLSKPALPVVLFIEDVHNTDTMLLELLEDLVAQSGAPIMIVTTGWPGVLDKDKRFAKAIQVAGDRRISVAFNGEKGGEALPEPFPKGAAFGDLTSKELAELLLNTYENVAPRTRDLLIQSYRVPLELELVLRYYVDLFPNGRVLELNEKDVKALPKDIEEIYDLYWKAMPKEVQKALWLSTLGIPAALLQDANSARTWDSSLLATALAAHGFTEQDTYLAGIDEGSRRFSWVQDMAGALRQFSEARQLEVATRRDSLPEILRRGIQIELLAEADRRLADVHHSGQLASDAVAGGTLVLALAKSDTLEAQIDSDLFMRATRAVMRHIEKQPLELPRIIGLGRDAEAIGFSLGSEVDRECMCVLAEALIQVGRPSSALEITEQLETWGRAHGDDESPEVLIVEALSARAHAESGNLEGAEERYLQRVSSLEAIGGRQGEVLMARTELGKLAWRLGRPHEAVVLLEDIQYEQEMLSEEESIEHLNTLDAIAEVNLDLGRLDEAWDVVARAGRSAEPDGS